MTTLEEFERLLEEAEGPSLEFKEARRRFGFDELAQYCVALANGGGGKIILGVSDGRPRQVVGTQALHAPGETEASIYDRLRMGVTIEELDYEGQRVLIVHVPGRLPGQAWSDKGRYLMRAGDAIIPMPDDHLRRIHAESVPDSSATVCEGASLGDLNANAIAEFRQRWARREENSRIATWSDDETLRNAELLDDGSVTFAALVLFGTRAALTRYLAQAEVVFEYRSSEAAGPAQDREEFREGFLLYHDRLWDRINLRNDRQSYQDGLFRVGVPTFDEMAIREAVLNAVCHREYRLGGLVFVRQYARRIEIVSPGGFPPGVTTENILDRQNPRNRRLAEALARCGLVERAGQGVNLMFERSIRQSKPLPEFETATPYEVRLVLRGNVTNPAFLQFLEKVGEETLASFDTYDLLVLDSLQREERVPEGQKGRLQRLVESGVIERVGRGRGARYLLSRRFYGAIGRRGAYTRHRGLDRETNKALLEKHIRDHGTGCPMSELQEVLPNLSRAQIKRLLDELRREGKVQLKGERRWARWFPGAMEP